MGCEVASKVGELPPAMADPSLVRMVLVSLLTNAVKATRHRDDPEIEITGRSRDNDNVYSVRDNGIGFGTADAERAFVLFQKLHDADQFEGVGAGLAVAKRAVERHGGRVWAESTPGEGSVFHFTLPKGRDAGCR
jgi:light-regulated signal transduction histidine kinase (bacteriophytochrome)